jgi:hypothetical protein
MYYAIVKLGLKSQRGPGALAFFCLAMIRDLELQEDGLGGWRWEGGEKGGAKEDAKLTRLPKNNRKVLIFCSLTAG